MTDKPVLAGAVSRPIDGVWLSIGTFTAIRVPAPRAVDPPAWRIALFLAPLWGAALGLLAGVLGATVWWLATAAGRQSPLVALLAGGLVFGAYALLTRGLHLDGLADTADGFASSRRGAAALAVMRDPALGALGGLTLTVVVLLAAAALGQLVSAPGSGPAPVVATVAAVLLLARAPLPWITRRSTPEAESGLGRSAIGAWTPLSAAAVGASWTILGVVVLIAAGAGAWVALAAAVGAWLVAAGLRAAVIRRFGVVNGDSLGAAVELAGVWLLVVLALVG